MKPYLTFIFLFVFCLPLFAQQTDSLENALRNHTAEDTTRVNILNQLAWNFRLTNQAKSLTYIAEAEKIVLKIGYEKGLATLLLSKTAISIRKGDFGKAVESVFQALPIFQKMDDQNGMAQCYNYIGLIQNGQKNYTEGIENFKKAGFIFKKLGENLEYARMLNNIGHAFIRSNSPPDSALLYLNEAQTALGNHKTFLQLYVHANLGAAYHQKKNYDLAKKNFLKVINDFEKGEINDQYIYARSSIRFASIFLEQNNLPEAMVLLQKGLKIAKLGNLKPEIQELSEKIAECYRIQNRFDSAFYYKDLSAKIKDSLAISESAEKLVYAQAENEREKQNILLKLQQEENQNQRLILLVLFVFLGGMGILLLFIFRSQKRIQKAYQHLEKANSVIDQKNKKIGDSIHYAQRIQNALLPFQEQIEQSLGKEHFFIFYQPRDVVSGDFYFFEQVGNKQIIAAADCTGHGVPGALMSMIGINLLEEIVVSQEVIEPNEILNQLHKKIRYALKQNETRNRDGMDIALCVIDRENKTLVYAGAKNPLYLLQNGELIELKADKKTIGGHQSEEERFFSSHKIQLEKESLFYIFSDGYQDQFGGENNQKFMIKRFREFLFSIHQQPLAEQKMLLEQKLTEWRKGIYEQTDDILVIGVKIV